MVSLNINKIKVVRDAKLDKEEYDNKDLNGICDVCGSQLVPDGRGGCMKCLTCGNSVGHCDV